MICTGACVKKLSKWITVNLKKYAYILHLVVFCCSLTYWGRVSHICVSKLTIIESDNGLSPERRQAIIWTNAGILLIGPLGTNLNETSIEIHTYSFKKIHLKLSSGKWRPLFLGLNVFTHTLHPLFPYNGGCMLCLYFQCFFQRFFCMVFISVKPTTSPHSCGTSDYWFCCRTDSLYETW